jgi:hypothetical protein
MASLAESGHGIFILSSKNMNKVSIGDGSYLRSGRTQIRHLLTHDAVLCWIKTNLTTDICSPIRTFCKHFPERILKVGMVD